MHRSGLLRLGLAVLYNRTVHVTALTVAVAVSLWNVDRVPHLSVLPALAGLAPFVIGKYLLCPLRWHAISRSGCSRRWHLRAYAESELLGLISPWHAGADVWRVHRLKGVGLPGAGAVTEVALDRFVGALGMLLAVGVSGVALPRGVLFAALAGAAGVAGVAVVALAVGRRRVAVARGWPRPSARVLLTGVLLSLCYQVAIVCLLLGALAAVGNSVPPLHLVAVFGASQLAGALPGVHGASPREGALVAGLASIGVSLTDAFGAVALAALLTWIPALLLGGGGLLLRWRGWFSEPHAAAV